MSSAFYPLGMNSYNNRTLYGGYKSWKGNGVFSNPVGNTPSNIRPLTNNDPGNIFPTGFGLPRPIKHYRKGRVISIPNISENVQNSTLQNAEISLINYNINRYVKSSVGASLSGGAGGMGLVSQIIQNPGQTSFFENNPDEISNIDKLDNSCNTCKAVGVISSYYPNNTYLTENPNEITTSSQLCCNEQKKALLRVLPANTVLPKNYYTTLQQYRENRCRTYEQKAFNFQTPESMEIEASKYNNSNITNKIIQLSKPGSPLSISNTYFANCQPNGEIFESMEITVILRFIQILKNNSLLTEEELREISILKTLNELSIFIKNTTSSQKQEIQNLFIQYINNPYIGIPLSGPSNPIGCKLVVYKPNNSQYAQQGAVSSSTRTLKLNVNTIETNLASFNYKNSGRKLGLSDQNVGNSRTIPFILKNKVSPCMSQTYLATFQNPKTCFKGTNNAMIKELNSSNFGSTPPSYYDALYV
jgi:hypothetical protein